MLRVAQIRPSGRSVVGRSAGELFQMTEDKRVVVGIRVYVGAYGYVCVFLVPLCHSILSHCLAALTLHDVYHRSKYGTIKAAFK